MYTTMWLTSLPELGVEMIFAFVFDWYSRGESVLIWAELLIAPETVIYLRKTFQFIWCLTVFIIDINSAYRGSTGNEAYAFESSLLWKIGFLSSYFALVREDSLDLRTFNAMVEERSKQACLSKERQWVAAIFISVLSYIYSVWGFKLEILIIMTCIYIYNSRLIEHLRLYLWWG